ncbi:MAG: hypothetical protein AB7P04_15800 [Bacteriovoracia bacterium]
MKKHIFAIGLCAISATAFAGKDHHAPAPMPKEFDSLKALVGTWEGTTMMEGKEMKATTTYELTSGGTAIVEKLGPGTPHEMVSIYHKSGKSLAMTHYCAIGNQPFMKLKKHDGKTMAFEMDMKKPVGVDSHKEMHMHAVSFEFTDADHFKQNWTNMVDGKVADTAVFTMTRKK